MKTSHTRKLGKRAKAFVHPPRTGSSRTTPTTHLLHGLCQVPTEPDDVPAGRVIIQVGEEIPGRTDQQVSLPQNHCTGRRVPHGSDVSQNHGSLGKSGPESMNSSCQPVQILLTQPHARRDWALTTPLGAAPKGAFCRAAVPRTARFCWSCLWGSCFVSANHSELAASRLRLSLGWQERGAQTVVHQYLLSHKNKALAAPRSSTTRARRSGEGLSTASPL